MFFRYLGFLKWHKTDRVSARALFAALMIVATCSVKAATINDVPPRLADMMAASANISGSFIQTKRLADIDVSLRASGTFHFKKDTFLEWKTLEPLESTFIATPTNYTIVADGQTTSKAIADLKISEALRPILTGDIKVLFDHFSADFSESTSNAWTLALTPKTKEVRSFVSNIALYGDALPRSFSITYANGDMLTISLIQSK